MLLGVLLTVTEGVTETDGVTVLVTDILGVTETDGVTDTDGVADTAVHSVPWLNSTSAITVDKAGSLGNPSAQTLVVAPPAKLVYVLDPAPHIVYSISTEYDSLFTIS